MSSRERSDDESFHTFVARSTEPLTRLAYLLCGDQHFANDLVQTGLVRLYQAWPKVRDKDAAGRVRQEGAAPVLAERTAQAVAPGRVASGVVPDHPAPAADPAGAAHHKEVLRVALTKLPPRQRAAVVLRYWSQHSVTETAAILRCSEGTVKSQSARGLASLRAALDGLGAEALEELTLMTDDITRGFGPAGRRGRTRDHRHPDVISRARMRTRSRRAIAASALATVALVGALVVTLGNPAPTSEQGTTPPTDKTVEAGSTGS